MDGEGVAAAATDEEVVVAEEVVVDEENEVVEVEPVAGFEAEAEVATEAGGESGTATHLSGLGCGTALVLPPLLDAGLVDLAGLGFASAEGGS